MAKEYNPMKLHNELVNSGLEIHGCDSNGGIHWKTEPTKTDLSKAKTIMELHDPTPEIQPPTADEKIDKIIEELAKHSINVILDNINT